MRGRLCAFAAAAAILGAVSAEAATTLDRNAAYPEGPLWRNGALYYAEMGADKVSRYDPVTQRKAVFFREAGCGPTAIAPYGAGGFLVLCHLGGYLAVLNSAGSQVQRIGAGANAAKPEGRALQAIIGMPNDASADARGGVYFTNPGPFSKASPPSGQVVHIDAAGAVRSLAQGLWYPNGVFFDAGENALYVSEHLGRRIWRFTRGPDGALASAAIFVEIDAVAPASTAKPYAEAGPDGLERAPNGDLVVALYGEARLLQITPAGTLRRAIATPFAYVTNIAFAPDGAAIVVGAFDNQPPDYPGAVLRLSAETFAVAD
jgi:gluconolactonase